MELWDKAQHRLAVAKGLVVKGHSHFTQHHGREADQVRKALDAGAEIRPGGVVLQDLSGDCESPVYRQVVSTPAGRGEIVLGQGLNRIWLDRYMRCRKCRSCRKQRQRMWVSRILTETEQANRTWFGTLTLRPEEHYRARCMAQSAGGATSSPEAEISKWITLYFKRLRKAGYSLRYIVVMERHKSGLPHWHLLVHEVLLKEVPKRVLQAEWPYGFTVFRLVAEPRGAARYVAKYLLKEDTAVARVRASVRYGQTS